MHRIRIRNSHDPRWFAILALETASDPPPISRLHVLDATSAEPGRQTPHSQPSVVHTRFAGCMPQMLPGLNDSTRPPHRAAPDSSEQLVMLLPSVDHRALTVCTSARGIHRKSYTHLNHPQSQANPRTKTGTSCASGCSFSSQRSVVRISGSGGSSL